MYIDNPSQININEPNLNNTINCSIFNQISVQFKNSLIKTLIGMFNAKLCLKCTTDDD